MHHICSYYIEVQGEVVENVFNLAGPLEVQVTRLDTGNTLFSTSADQAGFIGLLRHLHQQGYILLAASRERQILAYGFLKN